MIVAAAGPAIQLAQSMTFRPVKRLSVIKHPPTLLPKDVGGRAKPGHDTRPDLQGARLLKMIVPDAANMPPTPWQTEIFAPGI
jgi:hypothetical protein